MRRDPVCGMAGVIERHGRWFCSERCVREFEHRQSHHLPGTAEGGPPTHAGALSALRQVVGDPWIWTPLSGIALATLGWWWPGAAAVSATYVGYLEKMLGPLMLGLLLGGVIEHVVPRAYIVHWLAGPRKRVIVRSTLLGFLASACSHGCLALAVELYRKGASTPAVVSFLLASPWASLSLTFVLLSLFGWKGFIVVGAALLIAFITGILFQRLAERGLIERNPYTGTQEPLAVWQDLRARLSSYPWTVRQLVADARGVMAGTIPLGRMVLGWVQLGLVLSSVLGGLVPHGIVERFFGPTFVGLVLTLVVAAVVEVCSEGTAPIAFELYRQTGALGNAFVLLMGGVVTDYTELAVLWTAIGRRTVFWVLGITLPLVVTVGLLLNRLGVH